jgi:EAL and modified HD-GYP domain-containing signal transduction protein
VRNDFLIGRQQIFDCDLRVFAYELLFRDINGNSVETFGPTAASNQVIVDSLLEYGLDKIVGKQLAFINLTRENLLSETPSLLPKDKVVLEVLEDVQVDDALIQALRHLVREGYKIALDDFEFEERWLPVVEMAHFIKFDIQKVSPATSVWVMDRLKQLPIRFLAEKVETQEQYLQYKALGCQYFQGYYFSRPNTVRGKRLETTQHAVLQLLAKINRPNISIPELAHTISMDVGLTYKLLRYINSAFYALPKQIDSLQFAITYLGIREIQRWASLVSLASFRDRPREILKIALIRAKMCESLAVSIKLPNSEQFFLVGLMSTIDQLLEVPLDEAVAGLPLSGEVKSALVSHAGLAGEALSCAVNFERWKLDAAHFEDLGLSKIGEIHLESVGWANKIAQVLEK